MGLAASQARYLALTARKSDLEYQSQTINTRRIQLAYKTAEIATAYSEGMSNSRIQINTGMSADGTAKNWEALNFSNLLDGGYTLIGINGNGLQPAPYITDGDVSTNKVYIPTDKATNITASAYENLSANNKAAYVVYEDLTSTYSETMSVEDYNNADEATKSLYDAVTSTEDNKTIESYKLKEGAKLYKVNPNLTEEQYEAMDQDLREELFGEGVTIVNRNQKVNPKYYTSKNALDVESLLHNAKAQIVTKEFYNYLCTKFGYTYADGISYAQFQAAQNQFKSEEQYAKLDTIVEWQADETSTFQEKTYTADDAQVLATYQAETAKIQAQDKILETQEKNIETQHKAIETELEGLQKVIQNNIEKTFKMFS